MKLPSEIIEALGWTLLHSLWQAAVVALLLGLFNRAARRAAPDVRYAAAAIALFLLIPCAVGTFLAVHQTSGNPPVIAGENRVEFVAPAERIAVSESASRVLVPIPSDRKASKVGFAEQFPTVAPWIVGSWILGVLLFSLRMLRAWGIVRKWKRSGIPVEAGIARRFDEIGKGLGLRRAMRLLASTKVIVPMVIGWLRPVVLVPTSLFTTLSPSQLDAILAHEHAHIRRHDYLVNLVQCLVETLFFFHPAVWWISARLRLEREHCCDDAAASICGGPHAFARALATLEEMRLVGPPLLVAANGGSLVGRIRRLVGAPVPRSSWPIWPIILCLTALGSPLLLLHAADEKPAGVARPEERIRPFFLNQSGHWVYQGGAGSPASEDRLERIPRELDVDWEKIDMMGIPDRPSGFDPDALPRGTGPYVDLSSWEAGKVSPLFGAMGTSSATSYPLPGREAEFSGPRRTISVQWRETASRPSLEYRWKWGRLERESDLQIHSKGLLFTAKPTDNKDHPIRWRRFNYNDPARIIVDTSYAGFDDLSEKDRSRLISRLGDVAEPRLKAGSDEIAGTREIVSAVTERRWIVDGKVTDREGHPLSDAVIEAVSEANPTPPLGTSRTDASGRFNLLFQMPYGDLMKHRGVRVTPKREGLTMTDPAEGSFNALFAPDEKPEAPRLEARDFVLGEINRMEIRMHRQADGGE